MRTLTNKTNRSAADERSAILRRHGFEATPGGWDHGAIHFRDRNGWIEFTAPWPEKADSLRATGAPSLWKPVGEGGQVRRVFSVHQRWLDVDDLLLVDEEQSAFDAVVEWALATAEHEVPTGWTAPDRCSVDACLDKKRLTLTHRGFTRQMQIIHAPDRFALRLPLLPVVPPNLPEARLRWLRTLLLDAQNSHHLLRLGFAQEGTQTSVIAEVDLTGVPTMLLEPLLSRSCDALRWVVAWLVESADFLAQAYVASRALEICAPSPQPIGEPTHDHDH